MTSSGARDSQSPDFLLPEEADHPVELKVELRPRIVLKMHGLAEMDAVRFLGDDIVGALVDGRRSVPVVEVEGIVLLEENGKLAAFGAEPEAVLAAEAVHVKVVLARGDQLPVDPAEARPLGSARRARHDPALEVGADGHLGQIRPWR